MCYWLGEDVLVEPGEAQMDTLPWNWMKSTNTQGQRRRHHITTWVAATAVEQEHGDACRTGRGKEEHDNGEAQVRSMHEPHAGMAQAVPEGFQMDQSSWKSLVGGSGKKNLSIKTGTKTHESVIRGSICIHSSA